MDYNLDRPFYSTLDQAFRDVRWLDPNIEILPADRRTCPVCGHPSGDCVGESDPPTRIVGVKAEENLVYVEEDVWQIFEIMPGARTKVLVAKAGEYITAEKAREIGLT